MEKISQNISEQVGRKEAGRPGRWKNNNQIMKVSDLDENETNSLTGNSVILHRAFNANKFHFYHFGMHSEAYRQFEKSC